MCDSLFKLLDCYDFPITKKNLLETAFLFQMVVFKVIPVT